MAGIKNNQQTIMELERENLNQLDHINQLDKHIVCWFLFSLAELIIIIGLILHIFTL